MIQRVVTVKLRDAYRDPESLRHIVAETERVLPQAHGVREVRVGLAGDGRTRREWDVCILVRFDAMDDVDRYRDDPVHRAYADVFLAPLRESIRVWNFALGEEPADA